MTSYCTSFPSLFDPNGTLHRLDWRTFGDRLPTPRYYGALKTKPPRVSFASFHGNRRALVNLRAVYAITTDLDHGAPSAEAIRCALDGIWAFAHTTWSSTEAAPRWRVIIPTRPLTREQHDRVWRYVAIRLERASIVPDYAARDAARCWAVPALRPSYQSHEWGGAELDVSEALLVIPPEEKRVARVEPDRSDDLTRRIERARRWLACVDGAVSGAGGHAVTFRAAVGLTRGFNIPPETALELLIAEYNPRCAPPWSVRELQHKVRQASQRSRLDAGYLADRRAS